MEPVALVDLAAQHQEIAEEVRSGWDRVLDRGTFVLGPELEAFEHELASSVGAAAAVGVASGTDALELALRSVGIGPGDEVVIPALTFVATAGAIARIGARPVLVDVSPDTMLIDLDQAAAALDAGARAIVPVHLHGQLAATDDLVRLASRNGATVVEDAAQSHGATRDGVAAGGFGVLAATSFYPGKNLGAYGDGGAIWAPDHATADRLRSLRNHGASPEGPRYEGGWNSRLDELQAVVLRAKLRRLDRWNEARAAAASRYDERLAELQAVTLPVTAPGNVHAWHLYAIRVPHRDQVFGHLQAAGINVGVHYDRAIHQRPAFAHLPHPPLPVSERAVGELLSLPMGPHLTESAQDRVAGALQAALRQVGAT